MSAAERRTIHFSGHVQGVGFRYTARDIATQFDIRGFVRNLPDGSVGIVAEGSPRELDEFLQSVRDRMSQFIRKVTTNSQPSTGEFMGFSVRH